MSQDLLHELDAAVVGSLDGHGRTVLWRSPGLRDVAAAVRQAAVLPGPLDQEPGWMLRRLPDGRAIFLVGGRGHPDLVDAFGRTGIFSGLAIVATPSIMAEVLACEDPVALCNQVVKCKVRGMGIARALDGLGQPLQWGGAGDLAAADWPTAQAMLAQHGLRDFAGPIEGQLAAVDEPLPAGPVDPVQVDAAEPMVQRILAAWR